MEYLIVGDTDNYTDCLIYRCLSEDSALRTLNQMKINPTEHEKDILQTHKNLRIKKANDEDCWWNTYGTD